MEYHKDNRHFNATIVDEGTTSSTNQPYTTPDSATDGVKHQGSSNIFQRKIDPNIDIGTSFLFIMVYYYIIYIVLADDTDWKSTLILIISGMSGTVLIVSFCCAFKQVSCKM